MTNLSIKQIGLKLKQAGRLENHPVCVYGSKRIPEKAIPMVDINRCVANAIFNLSISEEINAIYIGATHLERCCPGGRAWLGYESFNPHLKYFLSVGSEDFRGGSAEFLLANPGLAENRLKAVGKITALDDYTIVQKVDSLEEESIDIRSFLCFGRSEQVRNLCSLAYFRSNMNFLVTLPWGPSCASFVSYPAGLTENGQDNCVVVGPTDPTGNRWFPKNYLSIGIPLEIASRMASDLDNSFILKRPKIAYPEKRISF